MGYIVDLALNTLIALMILALAGIMLLGIWAALEQKSTQYHPLERSCGVHIVCLAA